MRVNPVPDGGEEVTGERRVLAAWRSLGGKEPTGVQLLFGRNPRTVYRLLHAGVDGEPVIAKRYRVAKNEFESLLYREVLPLLPVTTPRFYGDVDAGDGSIWIFLEDVGSERFSADDRDHQTLAAHWLATLHVAAAEVLGRERLPDRGSPYYRTHLETGRGLIVNNLMNPALGPHDIALLGSVLTLYETVERRWQELEELCAASPSTLIHGDFRRKNLFVRTGPSGLQLVAIDWETAGWGTPAVDLAPMRHRFAPQLDIEAYCRIVRRRWRKFDLPQAYRLMWLGLIFRRLAAMEWAAVNLRFPRPDVLVGTLSRIRIYHHELDRALTDPEWGAAA